MKKEKLIKNSKLILADLIRAGRPLSIKKIAERNDMAWQTAKNNLKRLQKRKLVKCEGKHGKRGKKSCEATQRAIDELGY